MAVEHILVADVDSSMLRDVLYNRETDELTVSFVKGGSYTYAGVPGAVAQGLVDAASKGHFMHANVLGVYPYRRNG